MAEKINSKRFPLIAVWVFLIAILLYTRFINLGWGLPSPFHPDERNMSDAIMRLSCHLPTITVNLPSSINGQWDIFSWIEVSGFDLNNCFNPGFFAYGQFPLYLGYLLANIMKFINNTMGTTIDFTEATMSLRTISAFSSVITAYLVSKIVGLFYDHKHKKPVAIMVSLIAAIFAPYAIQFSHFGTTESLLMLFYTGLVYISLKLMSKKITELSFVSLSALITGMAVASKVSAASFLLIPLMAILVSNNSKLPYPFWYDLGKKILDGIFVTAFSAVTFLFLSPHTIINFEDFIGSIKYESGVALGQYLVFYTRQFLGTAPVLFQMENVFPFALGIGGMILFIIGFFVLNWSNPKINFLRLSFLWYFLTSAFMFAKWTRFLAPVYPIMTVIGALFFLYLVERNDHRGLAYAIRSFFLSLIFVVTIIPGIAYLSVYSQSDVRVKASKWIYDNIPENSYILSETANVVDVPLYLPGEANKNYRVISFNFYDLETDPSLKPELIEHINSTDYIFVPSRRLFANHDKSMFPTISGYYDELFSGRLGFKEVAKITSYPKIEIAGYTLIELQDEMAEETWTVFDHPVIRVYKRS